MANNTDLVKELLEVTKFIADDDEGVLGKPHDRMLNAKEVKRCHKALQRARDALRWIPVSERLPEKSGLYFATMGDDETAVVVIVHFNAMSKQWRNDYISAWRPLPAPYTPEEK